MPLMVFGLHYHVININFYFFVDQIMQQSSGCTFVSSTSILKAKWHDFVAICPLWSNEGGFIHIFGSHLNLIVPWKSIHKWQQGMSCCIINQDINVGQGKIIFQVSVRDMSLKKRRFRYIFRVPLFLGKCYRVTTYFSLYKKKEKKY